MLSQIIERIHERIDSSRYARLNSLPVSKDYDRCTSIAPGPHTHNNAFVLLPGGGWYDHTLGKGGDVIELARWLNHNGDRGAAIRELAEICGIQIDNHEIEYAQSKLHELNDYILTCHKNLRPQDIEYIHSRAITDETIENLKMGYDPETDRLIIPYTRNGEFVYYAARRRNELSPQKYKKAYLQDGENGLENIPWGLDTLHRENDKVIHTCSGDFRKDEMIAMSEGMFDIMSFYQEGYKCLSPISGYFNKRYMPQVIGACKSVKLVVTSFDNDKAGMNFTKNMAMKFIMNGINFICVRLPKGIKDISDYYAAGGNLDELVADAVDGKTLFADYIINDPSKFSDFCKEYSEKISDKKEFRNFMCDYARFMDKYEVIDICKAKEKEFDKEFIRQVLSDARHAPSESILAKEILARFELMYVDNEGFFEYQNGVWKRISDYWVKKYIADRLGAFMNNSRIGAVANLLKSLCIRNVQFNRKNILNFQNGTLNLDTLELVAHSPDDLSTIQMTYDYDPEALCEKWRKFIFEIMSGDRRKIYLLQEAVGYVLCADCRLQTGFMLIGNGANGKSVFLSVLRNLFNPENCKSIEISQLAQPFYAIQLKDKLANFCSELGSEFKKAEAMFKKIISGNDAIYDSYKGKDGIEFVPRVKNFFACNSYITSNHIDYSILRRLTFIKFNERYEGKNRNTNLLSELLTELPGIMNWAIEGYKRLMKRGSLITCKESDETLQDFLYSVSPVDAFIREKLCSSYSGEYSINLLYNMYKEWCSENGHHSMSKGAFRRTFLSNIEIHRKDVKLTIEDKKEVFYFPKYTPEPENIYSDSDFLDDDFSDDARADAEPEVTKEISHGHVEPEEAVQEVKPEVIPEKEESESADIHAGKINAEHTQAQSASSPFVELYARTVRYFSEHSQPFTRDDRMPYSKSEKKEMMLQVCYDAIRKNYGETLIRNSLENIFAEGKKINHLPGQFISPMPANEYPDDVPVVKSKLELDMDELEAKAEALTYEQKRRNE